MLAVWEPILFTDMSKPGSALLERLKDRRVTHFWDPDHRVAAQIGSLADRGQKPASCCTNHGTLWDLAALYPADSSWADRLPRAIVFDGPVVAAAERIAEEIEHTRR